jgi:hypothetical protein
VIRVITRVVTITYTDFHLVIPSPRHRLGDGAVRGQNGSSATISVRLGMWLFRSAVNGYRAA